MLSRYLTTSLFLLSAIFMSALGTGLVENTLSAYEVVHAAEQEGAAFPHGIGQAPPFTWGVRTIGTPERKCVEFPSNAPRGGTARRSGEFYVGGIDVLNAHTRGKVGWATLHNPEDTKAVLVVRGSRLDRPEITSRFVSSHYGWPVLEDGHAHREYAFYPTAFSLPSAGRWLLIATSANDWGCFIVTVQPSEGRPWAETGIRQRPG